MDLVQCTFVNELGNTISLSVTRDERGITISASGPTGQTEHTWSPREASTLREMLECFSLPSVRPVAPPKK